SFKASTYGPTLYHTDIKRRCPLLTYLQLARALEACSLHLRHADTRDQLTDAIRDRTLTRGDGAEPSVRTQVVPQLLLLGAFRWSTTLKGDQFTVTEDPTVVTKSVNNGGWQVIAAEEAICPANRPSYFEVTFDDRVSGAYIGVCAESGLANINYQTYTSSPAYVDYWYFSGGNTFAMRNGGQAVESWQAGDRVGILVDTPNNRVGFCRNGRFLMWAFENIAENTAYRPTVSFNRLNTFRSVAVAEDPYTLV
ncbi:hypothetical protein KIPB_004432, partial [Kipferlia bialata]